MISEELGEVKKNKDNEKVGEKGDKDINVEPVKEKHEGEIVKALITLTKATVPDKGK